MIAATMGNGLLASDQVLPFGSDCLYSTVTDLARLRGWSTSVPMITAA